MMRLKQKWSHSLNLQGTMLRKVIIIPLLFCLKVCIIVSTSFQAWDSSLLFISTDWSSSFHAFKLCLCIEISSTDVSLPHVSITRANSTVGFAKLNQRPYQLHYLLIALFHYIIINIWPFCLTVIVFVVRCAVLANIWSCGNQYEDQDG